MKEIHEFSDGDVRESFQFASRHGEFFKGTGRKVEMKDVNKVAKEEGLHPEVLYALLMYLHDRAFITFLKGRMFLVGKELWGEDVDAGCVAVAERKLKHLALVPVQ